MGFNIKNFLNEESMKKVIDDFPTQKISVKKLHPSKHNFYNMDPKELEALKNTIELIGVQENLVVREITKGEFAGEYEIIAGHRRHLAVSELVEEGKATEFVPCKIDSSENGILQELTLIFTNSTQRERSDFEKMYEIQRVRELLEDYAKEKELLGRKRDVIAEILNTSKSTIARLDNIRRHLTPEFMETYKDGKLATATANEIAGLSGEGQKALWELYQKNGFIKRNEVAVAKQEERPQSLHTERKESETELEPEQEMFLQEEAEKENAPEAETEEMQQEGAIEAEAERVRREEKAEIQQEETEEMQQDKIKKESQLEVEEQEEKPEEPEEKEQTLEEESKVQKADVGYWGKETARELAGLAAWLREEELAVLQDIVLKLRERKENRNDK